MSGQQSDSDGKFQKGKGTNETISFVDLTKESDGGSDSDVQTNSASFSTTKTGFHQTQQKSSKKHKHQQEEEKEKSNEEEEKPSKNLYEDQSNITSLANQEQAELCFQKGYELLNEDQTREKGLRLMEKALKMCPENKNYALAVDVAKKMISKDDLKKGTNNQSASSAQEPVQNTQNNKEQKSDQTNQNYSFIQKIGMMIIAPLKLLSFDAWILIIIILIALTCFIFAFYGYILAQIISFFILAEIILLVLPEVLSAELSDKLVQFLQKLREVYIHYFLVGTSFVVYLSSHKFYLDESDYLFWWLFDQILVFYWTWSWRLSLYGILELIFFVTPRQYLGEKIREKAADFLQTIKKFWRQIVVMLFFYDLDWFYSFTGFIFLTYEILLVIAIFFPQKSFVSKYIQPSFQYLYYIGLIFLSLGILWSINYLMSFCLVTLCYLGIGWFFASEKIFKGMLIGYAVCLGLFIVYNIFGYLLSFLWLVFLLLVGIVSIVLVVFVLTFLYFREFEQSKTALVYVGSIGLAFCLGPIQSLLTQVIDLALHSVGFLFILFNQRNWSHPLFSAKHKKVNMPRTSDTSTIVTAETSEQEIARILDCEIDDYYQILGIESNSDQSLIKTAYMRKVRLVHPDKTQHSDAQEAFNYVSKSYEILSDESKRLDYDDLLSSKEAVFPENDNWDQIDEESVKHLLDPSIACKKCGQNHPRVVDERPQHQARWCLSCFSFHPAKNGDIWAEQYIFAGFGYFICLNDKIWNVSESFKCLGLNLPCNTHDPLYSLTSQPKASGSKQKKKKK